MVRSTLASVVARTEARAKVDPDFADLLSRLVDLPSAPEGLERAAAADINDRRRRQARQEFQAAALKTSQVQHLLGLGTPQAVHRLRSRGRIIGTPIGNQTWFPAWQFTSGILRPELPKILDLLGRFSTDVVAVDRAMRTARDDLRGMSIRTALDEDSGAAWTALAELAS